VAMDHDRLFKELIRTFFAEFMELFFPEVHEVIDFNHVIFLSEEVFTDIVIGEKRKVDILIETKLKSEEALIVVHFESQAQYQEFFAERMFLYYSRLYEKYRKRIIPIAIFSYDEMKNESNLFEVTFSFKDILKFQFYKVELRRMNWRDFIKRGNPVAAALLSKMGYNKRDRIQVKLEFLRMLLYLELDPARMHLITGFFDTYLVLDDIEESKLWAELRALDPKEEAKLMEIKTNWEKSAEARILELKPNWEKTAESKGITQGKVLGEQKILKKFMQAHFGESSKGLLDQISQLTDLDIIEYLTDQLFQNSSFEEAKRLIAEAYEKQQLLD
jgi:hypothetical protein